MIRLIIIATLVVSLLILGIPVYLFEWVLGKLNPHKKSVHSLWIIQTAFRFLLKVSGADVTVKGLEHIPRDQAVLYVANHRSYYDILVGYIAVPRLTGFIAKKEMKKCLLLVDWMKNLHCLFLDRDNMKEGLKTILAGVENIKNGISMWVFPEGTRNKDENILNLLEFKEGSIKLAQKSGALIIPVAIAGTAELFEKQFPRIKPGKVTIHFGEPIDMNQLEPEEKKFCGAYTRNVIISMLQQE